MKRISLKNIRNQGYKLKTFRHLNNSAIQTVFRRQRMKSNLGEEFPREFETSQAI